MTFSCLTYFAPALAVFEFLPQAFLKFHLSDHLLTPGDWKCYNVKIQLNKLMWSARITVFNKL